MREVATALRATADSLARLADLQEELEAIAARPAMSPKELAEVLGVSVETIYRRIAAGTLPSFKFGGQIRIPYSAVEAVVADPKK
jgi:excisionase family DNA binding protein